MNLLIWWTSQIDYHFIGDRLSNGLPVYLRDQYRSRYGRAGHGRLWVDDEFCSYAVSVNEAFKMETPLCRYLAEYCGGIVINADSKIWLQTYPGIITTLNLERA